MSTIEGRLVPIAAIDIAPEYERPPSLVEDDALRKSIETQGIQQPLVLITKPNGRYDLIDGGRRLEIASLLDFKSVPAVVDQLPEGVEPTAFQNRLRFVLDECRQDLFPSQRAFLIRKMMTMFDMTQKEVAAYLGVDPGSISGWMAIESYAPDIVKAIDTGEITAFHARSFDGVKPNAQIRLFRAHRKEIANMSGGQFHKMMRTKYDPAKHPQLYSSPEHTIEKLSRPPRRRASRSRPTLSRDDKQRMMNSLEMQETEARDLVEEIKLKKRICTLAGSPISAILRHEDFQSHLDRLHVDRQELEVFSESF